MTLISRLSFLRHVRSLRLASNRHRAGPSHVVGTALNQWCSKSFKDLPTSSLPVHAGLQTDEAMHRFVSMLLAQPFLESAYWLSSTYALLAGDTVRKDRAMYFTPPSLTARLLDDLEKQGVDFTKEVIYDPACGGAAFLAPIAMRVRTRLNQLHKTPAEILLHAETHLLGTDIDSTLCELSNHFIKMIFDEEIQSTGKAPTLKITTANSLISASNLFGKIDVVVCNPPYRKMSSDEVKVHRAEFAEIIESQPNIYSLFIGLCAKLLRPDGICALVTPTSFLSGQNFTKLRKYLVRETKIAQIGMVSDRVGVFIDVEQETALTLLRRLPTRDERTGVQISVVSPSGRYSDVGSCVLPSSGAVWPIPRSNADVAILANIEDSPFHLEDYGYKVRIGTFVWNRDTRPVYVSEATAARCKTKTAVPLIWSSDIRPNGTLHFDGKKKENTEPRFVNLGSKDHPSIIKNPSVILQRVTSNDQPRRLVSCAVPNHIFEKYGGFVGENHTVIIEQTTKRPVLSATELAELLSNRTIDRCFRCISGATNVSAYELTQLRLPDPKVLRHLIDSGKSVDEALSCSLPPAVPQPNKAPEQAKRLTNKELILPAALT